MNNMNIGIIVATTQKDKADLIFDATKDHTYGNPVHCFTCEDNASYIDIALRIGLLLNSEAIDFMISGCSSGQGMMLACNSIPNVLCGYTPTKKDAYLFARINNGNCISLPLGFDFDLSKEEIGQIIDALFCEEMGNGYPREHAERKRKDTEKLKQIRQLSQISYMEFLEQLDQKTVQKLFSDSHVIDYVLKNGKNEEIKQWIKKDQCAH